MSPGAVSAMSPSQGEGLQGLGIHPTPLRSHGPAEAKRPSSGSLLGWGVGGSLPECSVSRWVQWTLPFGAFQVGGKHSYQSFQGGEKHTKFEAVKLDCISHLQVAGWAALTGLGNRSPLDLDGALVPTLEP